MKRRVRIKSLPEGYHMMPDGTIMKGSAYMADGGMVNKNLSSISRNMANLEAEKGEVAMTDLGKTGVMGLYNIGGQRHSNGGTPLNLDPGSFIYSDTRKMKIKDPEFLAKYGKTKPITPAKLVKPFLGINDFTNTLYDQTADPIQKRTAQSMIDKYKGKAGEIAFYQEAMKGFPQGVPAVAKDYAEGIMGAPMMAYGGYLPKAEVGTIDPRVLAAFPQHAPKMPIPQISVGPRPVPRVAVPNPRTNSQESRSDKFQAIDPNLIKVLFEAGLNPLMDAADYSDQDRLEYDKVQKQIAGYPGMYEDAQKNLPGWSKRMESLGYDFADWKDAKGDFDLKSLKGEDPRVRSYQEWWNPRVDQFITEENEKRQNAGYPAFTEAEIKAIKTQKFSDPNDPNAQPGSKKDSKLGTYTTNRLLAEGKYEMQEDTVYFCVDGQVIGQSVRPGSTATSPSGENVKGPYKTQQEANENCVTESTLITPEYTPDPKNKTYRFQQDINNLNTNTRNQLSERKYFPFAPRLSQTPFDPTYLDDTRQQQQIAGRARGTMEALGAFTGPGRQASMASSVAGQAGEQAANVAATIGNQNVGISNWANQFNAQMKNQRDTINAASAKSLYDDTVTVQDTYDEKMRSYRTKGNALNNTMETNLAKAKLFNQLYPDFQINTMPGMYGEVTANPEVLRAMQDVGKYKGMTDAQKAARQESINEVFTLFPVTYDKEGKDMYAQQRAALLTPILKTESSKQSNPLADFLEQYSSQFPQQ